MSHALLVKLDKHLRSGAAVGGTVVKGRQNVCMKIYDAVGQVMHITRLLSGLCAVNYALYNILYTIYFDIFWIVNKCSVNFSDIFDIFDKWGYNKNMYYYPKGML